MKRFYPQDDSEHSSLAHEFCVINVTSHRLASIGFNWEEQPCLLDGGTKSNSISPAQAPLQSCSKAMHWLHLPAMCPVGQVKKDTRFLLRERHPLRRHHPLPFVYLLPNNPMAMKSHIQMLLLTPKCSKFLTAHFKFPFFLISFYFGCYLGKTKIS